MPLTKLLVLAFLVFVAQWIHFDWRLAVHKFCSDAVPEVLLAEDILSHWIGNSFHFVLRKINAWVHISKFPIQIVRFNALAYKWCIPLHFVAFSQCFEGVVLIARLKPCVPANIKTMTRILLVFLIVKWSLSCHMWRIVPSEDFPVREIGWLLVVNISGLLYGCCELKWIDNSRLVNFRSNLLWNWNLVYEPHLQGETSGSKTYWERNNAYVKRWWLSFEILRFQKPLKAFWFTL